jgi:two-component system, probable response regulator PhcQ
MSTILVVDDDELVLSALRSTLLREKYEVFAAAGPEEGLKILKEYSVDVVISDHMMPRMTGIEFLKLVRDRHPAVGRILLTGMADKETAIKAVNEAEIYRFLEKPWDATSLKVIVHLALEQVEQERCNRVLLAIVRRQGDFLRDLQAQNPGIFRVDRDIDGAIILSDEELGALAV